jgi:uncharacterized protein (DUF4415 family)
MSKDTTSTKSESEGEAKRVAAAFGGDVPELDEGFFRGARVRSGGTVIREAAEPGIRRGRPPLGSSAKVQQSLRLSPEVLDFFRATGEGWQAKMDQVLLEHVRRQLKVS